MATIKFKNGSDYELKLSRLEAGSERIAKLALAAGADILADEVRANAERVLSGESTGAMMDSFGITPILQDDNGYWNVKVGFDGYDSKGVPNQLKARVLESGSSDQPPRPFVRPAVRAAKQAVIDAMANIIDVETTKIMK